MLLHKLFVILLSLQRSCAEQKHQLLFSYITTSAGSFNAIGGRPVVDLALEEINSRSDILQNYTLNYTRIWNSECRRTSALNSFFEDFPYTYEPDQPTFVAVLCCGCSPATIPVAEISHYWNIPQVSFAAADNELLDRSRFKNILRTLPSLVNFGPSLAKLIQQFGWRQVALICQDETLFTSVATVSKRILEKENIIVDDSAVIPSDDSYFTAAGDFPYDIAFNWMTKRDFRVIYIGAYVEYTYLILCQAYERGLLPPRYVWITPMWYNRKWWKPVSEKLSFACTESELLQVLTGSIGIVPVGFLAMGNQTATFSKWTPTSFIKEYRRRLSLSQYSGLDELSIAGVAYDTIWSIALGLDRAMDRVAENNDSGCEEHIGELVPLEMFNYTNQMMGCVLEQSIAELEFTGITGKISFNEFGSRPDNLYLALQFRENNGTIHRKTFAEVNGSHFNFRVGEGETTLWKCWQMGIPYDGSPIEVIHNNSNISVGIIYALAAIGSLFTLACLLFNIIFQNKKVIKLSSPNINYIVIIGAALLYVCACLFATPIQDDTAATAICNSRIWLFSVGYTLCFAVILSKTWRIYYIFMNPTTKKKSIKDWILLVIIMVTFALDMLILLIGTAVPSSRLQGSRVSDEEESEHVTDDGINEEFYIYVCSVGDSVIWLALSFAYKGSLQIVAMFMAFHTRKVKIKALNESKETAAIIYINSIILFLMIVNFFILEGYHNTHGILSSLALLVQATLFLGILFIPKVIYLYRDPNGTKIFTSNITNNESNIVADHKTNNLPP